MASVYDLDELVQLIALHLGDYDNLGHLYMSAMDHVYTYVYLGVWNQECKQYNR